MEAKAIRKVRSDSVQRSDPKVKSRILLTGDKRTHGEIQSSKRQDEDSNELGSHLAFPHSLIDPLQDLWAKIGFPALLTDIG